MPRRADAAEQIGRRIAAELDARGLGRAEAVVAVGRNSIELRQLQLPPAPDEDLPDLVRFQATREFNELDDKWLLDFVPIDGSADSPRTVLATAIAPAVLAQIEAVCEHAGLKMRRLLLRPCEAALLLDGEKSIPRGQAVLLVNPLGVEADLTAVVDGTAVFLRTTRISSDPPPLQALLAEIRLTMAAASNQLGGRKIESIVLCGEQQPDLDLAHAIETELGDSRRTFRSLRRREARPRAGRIAAGTPGPVRAAGGHVAGRAEAVEACGRFPPSPPPCGSRRSPQEMDDRRGSRGHAPLGLADLLPHRSLPVGRRGRRIVGTGKRPGPEDRAREEDPGQRGRNRQVGRRGRDLARSHLCAWSKASRRRKTRSWAN